MSAPEPPAVWWTARTGELATDYTAGMVFLDEYHRPPADAVRLVPLRTSLPPRFWAKVDMSGPGGCWLWTAAHDRHGYGQFAPKRKNLRYAHRLSFEDAIRPLEPNEVVDHKCHVRNCVKPEHLQAVTHAENMQNLRGARVDSTSGVRGVYWKKGRWQVEVKSGGRIHNGGRFDDLAEATEAAIQLRCQLMTNNLLDREPEQSAPEHPGVTALLRRCDEKDARYGGSAPWHSDEIRALLCEATDEGGDR